MIDVIAYTNCNEVKLFLNDQLIGDESFAKTMIAYGTNQWEKKIDLGQGQKLSLDWKVRFVPGTLRAEGYKNGKLIATDLVKTSSDLDRIALIADHAEIQADGKDLSYITVKIKDREGTLVPDADHLVHFDIAGEGRIVGVGNGNPISLEPAKGSERRTFSGMCQVIVQSTGKKGNIVLKASFLGLQPETISITSN